MYTHTHAHSRLVVHYPYALLTVTPKTWPTTIKCSSFPYWHLSEANAEITFIK